MVEQDRCHDINAWEQRPFGKVYTRCTEKNNPIRFGVDKIITVASMQYAPRHGCTNNEYLLTYNVMKLGDIAFEGNRNKRFPFGRFVENMIGEGIVSHVFSVYRPIVKQSSLLFLKYYINNDYVIRNMLRKSTIAATMMRTLVDADLMRQTLTLPSGREQEKIGKLFVDIDNLIDAEKRKLDLLQKKKTALLRQIFERKLRFKGYDNPWNRHKLGSITDSYSGGTPPVSDSSYYGGDIPFIRSAEIANESTELFITQSGLAASSAKRVKKGDVLYALYGANSGNASFAKLDGAINQAVLSIRAEKGFSNSFIMYWLQRSKNAIIGTFLQGGQGNLSGSIVKKLSIQTPRIDEQERIGLFFIKIDSLITAETRKLDLLIDKKKALLQKMFV